MFNQVRDYIINIFKKWIVSFLFKKLLGGMVGGIKGFVLNYIIKKFFKEWLVPNLKLIFRKIHTVIKKPFYKKKAKKVVDAKTKDDWSDSVDNMP